MWEWSGGSYAQYFPLGSTSVLYTYISSSAKPCKQETEAQVHSHGLTQRGYYQPLNKLGENSNLDEWSLRVTFVYICLMKEYNPAVSCSAYISGHWWVMGFWTGSQLVWLRKNVLLMKNTSNMNKQLYTCWQGLMQTEFSNCSSFQCSVPHILCLVVWSGSLLQLSLWKCASSHSKECLLN